MTDDKNNAPFWSWLFYLLLLPVFCFITGIYLASRETIPYIDYAYIFTISPVISLLILDYLLIRHLREDVPKFCELLNINYNIDCENKISFQAKPDLAFSCLDKYFTYIALLTIWYSGLIPQEIKILNENNIWPFIQLFVLAFLTIFYLIYINLYLLYKFIFIFCIKNLDLNEPILKQNREKIFKCKSLIIILAIYLVFYFFADCADFIAKRIT